MDSYQSLIIIQVNTSRTNQLVSKALMQKLKQTCVDLKQLDIQYSDLSSIDVNDLPLGIEELSIIKCEIPIGWFKNASFINLKALNLTGSSRTCSIHIEDMASNCSKSLKKLVLKDCYRIDDKAIEIITGVNKFDSLLRLNLSATSITQYAIQMINSVLIDHLEYLNIKECKHVTSNDIALIRSCLHKNNFEFEF